MRQNLLRETISQIKSNLQTQNESLQKKSEKDQQRIQKLIQDQAYSMNLIVDDGKLQNIAQQEEIIQKYDEILNLDDGKWKQWGKSKNNKFDLQNREQLDSSNIQEMHYLVDDLMFIEEDFDWQDHIQPISDITLVNNEQTKYRTQYHPQQEIINSDIYRVSIRQNHLLKNSLGFPTIILHPNIKERYVLFTLNNETLESLWCRVFQLRILEEFFIFYFYNQQQNSRIMLRNTPLITFTIDQPNLAIHLITSQQAYVPMIEYKLRRDSQKDEKKFIYYYKLQVENMEIQLCGDGIVFYEETKGYQIIQQILAGDKIFHKLTKRFCLVQSIHVVWPSGPIQAKLLDSCLNDNELSNINEYLFKLDDFKFLDEKKTELPVIYKIRGKVEFQLKIYFPPSCPMFLLSQYFIYDQQLLNHNSLTKFEFQEFTKTSPLVSREKMKNYPQIEFDLRQIEFQYQSFLIFICSKQKLLIQMDFPCEIVASHYEINTEVAVKQLNQQYGPGKLSVIGNGIQFNNNRIITCTFDLHLVYQLNTCHPNINVTFKLNENMISVTLCEDTKVLEISQIAEQLLNSKLEAQKYTVILNNMLLYNLKSEHSIKKYSINGKVDVFILKTSTYQALLFMLLLQNDTQYTVQQLIDSLNFITLPDGQPMEQLYKTINEGKLIQKVNYIPEMETFCLFIYTTSYLHQSLNQQIRDTQFTKQQNKWQIYLSTTLLALKRLPSLRKTLFRGIRGQVDYSKYKSGNYIYFQNFLSTSTGKDIAIAFSGDNGFGTLYEIDCLNSKSVSKFSQFPNENEFLIAPYSFFVVQSITKLANFTEIKLKEISCPRSLKLILWIDSQQLSEDLQFKLSSLGYEILYVNANVVDLQENFNLWGSLYNSLSENEMKIICNFVTNINLDLLECIFNTNQYNKVVYLYTKQIIFFQQYQYVGVYEIIDDLSKILEESKLIVNCHKNRIINNILNQLQLEPGMIDSRYNQQWLPGSQSKQGICKNLENWIGIGIRQSKQADLNDVTFYIGVQAQDIKQILQNINRGLNAKQSKLYQNQKLIIDAEEIYILTDANCAGKMQDPIQIGNLRVTFVLQVKANLDNLKPIWLAQDKKVYIKNTCLIYKIAKKDNIIVQRLLIQYN